MLLEILGLLLLSTFVTSPSAYGALLALYLAAKIARAWLKGCLPGGGLLGGSDEDFNDAGDCALDSGEVARRAANRGAGLPQIKLIPLDKGVSDKLDGVMADAGNTSDDNLNEAAAAMKLEPQKRKSGGNNVAMDLGMKPPKLKKEYRKERDGGNADAMEDEKQGSNRRDAMEVDDVDVVADGDTADGSGKNGRNVDEEAEEEPQNAIEALIESNLGSYALDCYPYSFSPLLLFANAGYFDRGYSNYNAVAAFFAPALRGLGGGEGPQRDEAAEMGSGRGGRRSSVGEGSSGRLSSDGDNGSSRREGEPTNGENGGNGNGDNGNAPGDEDMDDDYGEYDINMLHGVLYDRKNVTYDELFNYLVRTQSLVTCCIDAHFTAFQLLPDTTRGGKAAAPILVYYDPQHPSLSVVKTETDVHKAALYLLMKCHYGDNGHIIENKNYYTSATSTKLQWNVYNMWKKINNVTLGQLGIKWYRAPLNLTEYLFVNSKGAPSSMSTQLTGNTCYFQTYLFALLCKVGKPYLASDGRSISLRDAPLLEKATVRIAQFLLTFFVDADARILRPYTNSNFILDFYRYSRSPYYTAFVKYLEYKKVKVPDYEKQYEGVAMYYSFVKNLHGYDKFVLEGATASTPNSKSLQYVTSTDGALRKLGRGDYYKYRAANLMFGCNAGAMLGIGSFCEFNSWRKNQLLAFYQVLKGRIGGVADEIAAAKLTKYRDYYFMPQFEIGQQELIDLHHYTYLMDMCSMGKTTGQLTQIVHDVNSHLVNHIYFSTQHRNNYHKMLKTDQFANTRKYMNAFQQSFLTTDWFGEYLGLGFSEINPKEKDINSLTQTVFYLIDLMRSQSFRQEYEFEKECINQMARSNLRRFDSTFSGSQNASQKYEAYIKIGFGYTYSKYNTLMHFLNVAECYWRNPDVNNIQVFGKDIRTLLTISCQKIFFDPEHRGFYYYGPLELRDTYRTELDLAVASGSGRAGASVSMSKSSYSANWLMVTDRVYEFSYLKGILTRLFQSANNTRFKSDNIVLNLLLLSLQLDFGLFDEYASLLNIPFMKDLQHQADTRELQVEIANLIYDFDRKHNEDAVTRAKVEELIYEVSYKFLVNKNFDVYSNQYKLISLMNADSDYQEYVLLVKIYMSLCSINKSVEVDYYKIKVNGSFHIVIPSNFSKETSEYLEQITIHHSFSETNGIMMYDDIQVFDLRPHQPEINLYRIRLQPGDEVESMVKYVEISNVFQALSSEQEQYLIFIAENSILVDVLEGGRMKVRINQVDAKVATIFFNEAISFIPCFKYTEAEDVILFTSRNIHYLVDKGGQFCPDYYGMKHELIECIVSEELFVDLNDDPQFRSEKLSDLLTESKVVVYFPDYYLLVSSRQQLINLLDYAIYIRNIGFFVLVLLQLHRTSIKLNYVERNENKVVQITGPWKEAILYVMAKIPESHYDSIFERQFVNINQHKQLPLRDFIEVLSENFTRYQRHVDGEYQIIPREKQKRFLERIICGNECFHFSEVGTGKTKVIMPLLCQIFLSNNVEAHKHLARGGKEKDTLVILVPEHLLSDARTQVFRHCLNLNFGRNYKVFDDILSLLHQKVELGKNGKTIFVTSFNQFKKALTYDEICKKIRPHRQHILVVADEVDDFLDRDKLVFNICSNKANSFDRDTLEYFHEVSHAAYHRKEYPSSCFQSSPNPAYWKELHAKFVAIHAEIQDASKSLNKSFGIFNEKTLRHCVTSISHDIEGYKALIARPYESVNRAMPGSYYSDVERTIFLTFVILSEDIAKYDELFQGERKFITFEYWKEYLAELDYDELVYGHDRLSEIAEKHPGTLGGLIRFLYVIILKRMEVRDKSRSVNSVDIIFNFDCIGFTGTPFLDNYPTSDYIRHQREDDIPPCIDRSFYAYSSEALPTAEFEQRFASFQGQNSNVLAEYVSSDFMHDTLKAGEMETLEAIFEREEAKSSQTVGASSSPFNAIVDLCGIFKLSNIYDVRSLILKHFGPDCFHYIYHIDQTDGSDRILCIKSKNDVTFDEEFYKYLCRSYGAKLREKVFFFIDNRNYIGKDVPYQLVYQKHFKLPLFVKSVVIAHDVEDFSKIWQAMGRSRTMNETTFSIYKNNIPAGLVEEGSGLGDIKKHPLTKLLYTRNCDCKMAGNLSSIYQTLIALYNLSKRSFYYSDEIVNTFIEKMEKTIVSKVKRIEGKVADVVLGSPVSAQILQHIFLDKFRRSSNKSVAESALSSDMVDSLVRQIVRQKFEQRNPSGDTFDDYIRFLSGEQESLMEISYTKQQQKQKQKQKAKSHDSDMMDVFDKRNQLSYKSKMPNYYKGTATTEDDVIKRTLSRPVSVPILTVHYSAGGKTNAINVYPTVQFMYSHHIMPRYINDEVRDANDITSDDRTHYADFTAAVTKGAKAEENGADPTKFHVEVKLRDIRQNPQFSLVGLQPGVYIIGMKDQFNIHDAHPLAGSLQYAVDETGFVLFDKTNSKSVDDFGPYFIEQYILLNELSKSEVAQNVITYYCKHKDKLERCLKQYDEKQGKGFICWRFLINQAAMLTDE